MFVSEEAQDQRANATLAFPSSDAIEFLALTNGVAAGDESAANNFFQRYCDRLFRYALVLTRGNEDLSREILSVTMIKAIRTMRVMRSDEDIWRWLTRIAWTSLVDHCRKNKRRIPTVH